MTKLRLQTILRISAVSLAFAGLCLLVFCWKYQVWSYGDFQAREEIHRYPVGAALWNEQIRAGDDLGEFQRQHPPHREWRYGPFIEMNYYIDWPESSDCLHFESVVIVAKNGRLVSAAGGGCNWKKTFFEMTPSDYAAYNRALNAWLSASDE